MMNTGEKIKMLRKRAGMTQAELANRLGMQKPQTRYRVLS